MSVRTNGYLPVLGEQGLERFLPRHLGETGHVQVATGVRFLSVSSGGGSRGGGWRDGRGGSGRLSSSRSSRVVDRSGCSFLWFFAIRGGRCGRALLRRSGTALLWRSGRTTRFRWRSGTTKLLWRSRTTTLAWRLGTSCRRSLRNNNSVHVLAAVRQLGGYYWKGVSVRVGVGR